MATTASGNAPAGRFLVEDGTVLDTKTLLRWQRTDLWHGTLWNEAKGDCEGLNLGGYSSGWRLPTKKELETLVDELQGSPAADTVAFPAQSSGGRFWTTTPVSSAKDADVWVVDFVDGTTLTKCRSSHPYNSYCRGEVRCVRDYCAPGHRPIRSGETITCVDINECASANGGCSPDATCTNLTGSRTCACKTGFHGDGVTCSPVAP